MTNTKYKKRMLVLFVISTFYLLLGTTQVRPQDPRSGGRRTLCFMHLLLFVLFAFFKSFFGVCGPWEVSHLFSSEI